MTDLMVNIFIGVFSGILTSLILWLLIKLFKIILIPWYQQSVYRGIDISGEWSSNNEFAGKSFVEQTIQISQNGHKIEGHMISKSRSPLRGESIGHFSIEGEVFDNYVDIEYKIKDTRLISRGSILLKVREGGHKLIGGLVAIDKGTSDIKVAENIIWERTK